MCHHVIDLQSPRKAIMEVKARPMAAHDGHSHEQRRLAELSRYAISTERPDPKLDIITRLAVAMLGGTIGGISILQQERIWLPSRVGIDADSVSRAGSFCNWVLQSDGKWFEVEDACADPRFAANPLVAEAPFCRHYAAAPLHGARGYLLGTLWVMRQQPGRLDADQASLLKGLARLVVDTLELRYTNEITGMPNRAAFLHHLEQGLSGGEAQGDQVLVGFIDLRRFRHLNEAFGGGGGNHALRTIGQRLAAWCGLGNLTAHIGSDKFSFALFGTAEANAALLERLRDCLTAPIPMGPGGSHVVHARIGIERRERGAAGSAAALLDAAETAALSASSELSVTTLREYGADLLARSQLLIELRRTLQGEPGYGALQVHYQPQVDVAAGSPSAARPGAARRIHRPGREQRPDLRARPARAAAGLRRPARLARGRSAGGARVAEFFAPLAAAPAGGGRADRRAGGARPARHLAGTGDHREPAAGDAAAGVAARGGIPRAGRAHRRRRLRHRLFQPRRHQQFYL